MSISSKPAIHLDADKINRAALMAFFNITQQWGLTREQEQILLGSPPRSTFFKWVKEGNGLLTQDILERISYIMGIYKALHILLPATAADLWIKKNNTAPLFGGRPALEKMLAGHVVDLADVRRYLDAEYS
jgi:hypothetical protein